MNLKVFLIGLTGLVLFACGTENTTNPDLIEDGMVMIGNIPDTCLCEDLTQDTTGNLLQNDSLFTGVCIHNYPGTDQKYMVKNVLSGQLHGAVIYFDKQGNILVEEVYDSGSRKRSGEIAPLTCDCSELVQKSIPGGTQIIMILDGIPYTGKCLKQYPNVDQTYMEVNYKNGLLDGFSIYYDQTGNTMYMEKYERGELIKVLHENK